MLLSFLRLGVAAHYIQSPQGIRRIRESCVHHAQKDVLAQSEDLKQRGVRHVFLAAYNAFPPYRCGEILLVPVGTEVFATVAYIPCVLEEGSTDPQDASVRCLYEKRDQRVSVRDVEPARFGSRQIFLKASATYEDARAALATIAKCHGALLLPKRKTEQKTC